MNTTSPSVPPTSKEVCTFYYGNTPIDGNDLWKCLCGKLRKQSLKKGYQNLMTHVKSKHPEYIYISPKANIPLKNTVPDKTTSKYLVDPKSTNIFKWLEWIIMDEHELRFCEKKFTIQNTSLLPISTKTLKKYIFLLVRAVEEKISTIVNNAVNFALVFHRWTEKSTHFIGLFSTSPGNKESGPRKFLIAFASLFDETNFNAENYTTFIRGVLEVFSLNEENLICLIGENCSLNKSVANLMFVPLLGCRNHRLNLAIEAYIKENLNTECELVRKLMSKLTMSEESSRLRSFTPFRPVIRNTKRWLEVVKMFERLERLLPSLQNSSPEIAQLIPNAVQIDSIRHHKIALTDFKSIALKLQNQKSTISESHTLFQTLIDEFPNFDFNKYLGADAHIIHSPTFESAIIKIQNGDETEMTNQEKLTVEKLEKKEKIKTSIKEENLSFAERALKRRKPNHSEYVNTEFLLPTSNDVKRLFAMSKRVCTSNRKTLSPATLEALIFLKSNYELWNLGMVSVIMKENNEDKGDEDNDSDNDDDDDNSEEDE